MTTLRRQVKNMVKNYSEAEVKVRDATSNDPWGPSSTLMGEISDLTYNIVALGEVMRMIWKRLNDHGKNWRHVYKSLVLLDYLIKNGNEKVAQQCKEHIVAIQTLKDFQYMEEQKDQGQSVREKAKQLVSLLRDDERLKAERAKAFKARERYAQNAMGISSDNKMVFATGNASLKHLGATGGGGANKLNSSYADPYGGASSRTGASALSPDLEAVRPSDPNEEDLQIKLAIMLSQQEHEEEVQRKRADDAKLQIALEQSKTEGTPNGLVDIGDNLFNDSWPNNSNSNNNSSKTPDFDSNNDDLFSVFPSSTSNTTKPSSGGLVDPWATPTTNSTNKTNGFDPWKTGSSSAPTNSNQSSTNPWLPTTTTPNASNNTVNSVVDPWGPSSTNNTNTKIDDFDLFSTDRVTQPITTTNTLTNSNSNNNNDPFGDFFGSSSTTTNNKSTNPWNLADTNSSNTKSNTFDPFSNNSQLSSSSNTTASATTNQNANLNKINPMRKTPESFLGENSSLVNLENLIPARPKSTNPFSSAIPSSQSNGAMSGGLTTSTSIGQLNNPFLSQQQSQKGPTINQLQQQSMLNQFNSNSSTPTPPPLLPTSASGQLAHPLIVPPPSVAPSSIVTQPIMPMPFMSTPGTTGSSPFGQPSLFPSIQPNMLNSNPIANLNSYTSSSTVTSANNAASTNPFLMM